MEDDEVIAKLTTHKAHGGTRENAGRKRLSEQPTAAQVKRDFFTGERLLELLNLELRMARNRPETIELMAPDGEIKVVKRRPYDGKVAQMAASDLLDRGFGKAVQAVDLIADINSGHPMIVFDFGGNDNEQADTAGDGTA